MQCEVYIFTIFAVSLAKDVDIYNHFDFYNFNIGTEPESSSNFPWKLGFHKKDRLNMEIHYRNKSSDVTAINVETISMNGADAAKPIKALMVNDSFLINFTLSRSEEVHIQLKLYKLNSRCAPRTVVKGRLVEQTSSKETQQKYAYNDICLKAGKPCVVVVDLKKVVCIGPSTVRRPTTKKATSKAPSPVQKNRNNGLVTPTTKRTYSLANNTGPSTVRRPTTKKATSKAPSPVQKNRNNGLVTPATKRTYSLANNTDSTVDTETERTTTSAKPFTTSSNITSISSNVSQHGNIETETKNITAGTDQQPLTGNNIFIYVIPSVVVMVVIVLAIYISVKKYSKHRNLNPVETIQLNTYGTQNEVVYADLSLTHSDKQPPKRDKESPYAQIIGVLKPISETKENK